MDVDDKWMLVTNGLCLGWALPLKDQNPWLKIIWYWLRNFDIGDIFWMLMPEAIVR